LRSKTRQRIVQALDKIDLDDQKKLMHPMKT
jgi:hypothetical protein